MVAFHGGEKNDYLDRVERFKAHEPDIEAEMHTPTNDRFEKLGKAFIIFTAYPEIFNDVMMEDVKALFFSEKERCDLYEQYHELFGEW